MKFWKEFKAFAFKGNVVDMAVGVMIGSAFTAIVNSVVKNIFTPLLSLLTGKLDFETALNFPLGEGEEAAVFALGTFIQAVLDFFLIAICIFLFVKFISRLRRKPEPEPVAAEPAPEPRRCPFCFSEIHENATRCPHCTSVIEE